MLSCPYFIPASFEENAAKHFGCGFLSFFFIHNPELFVTKSLGLGDLLGLVGNTYRRIEDDGVRKLNENERKEKKKRN